MLSGGFLMKQHRNLEEKMKHGTAELPIALHKLTYPRGTDMLFYLHWHKEFEILVITEGTVLFTIEQQEYLLTPGDFVFINSNYYHSARAASGEQCSFYALDFSYQLLLENLNTRFGRKYILPILNGNLAFAEVIRKAEADIDPSSWQAQIMKKLTEINKFPEEGLESHELAIKSHIFALWDLYYQNAAVKSNLSDTDLHNMERLKPVLQFIHENYSYEITLAELAGLIPMSEGQFCRMFKQTMKVTPVEYIIRYRILQSCRLLLDTDKNIGEIANLSGFNTISYYNRLFLQTIGCTPKHYRTSQIT
jgi:AraC family transcriptional regulator, melibiose operon regulatory protein